MSKRTEITIETSRCLVIRRSSGALRAWCERCLADKPMITPNEAAALMNVSSRSIYRSIEDGTIHFVECSNGLLVCADSLSALAGKFVDSNTSIAGKGIR